MKTYDAIIVLGGGVQLDGTLSATSKQRVDCAHRIYKKSAVPIIMSGKWSMFANSKPSITEASAMATYILQRGVASHHLKQEAESYETIGNAYYSAKQYILPHRWKNIVVITSDFHERRAQYAFQKVLGSYCSFQIVAAKSHTTNHQMQIRNEHEHKVLKLYHRFFGDIKNGDIENVGNVLRMLPEYSAHPRYSKQELLQMIHDIE